MGLTAAELALASVLVLVFAALEQVLAQQEGQAHGAGHPVVGLGRGGELGERLGRLGLLQAALDEEGDLQAGLGQTVEHAQLARGGGVVLAAVGGVEGVCLGQGWGGVAHSRTKSEQKRVDCQAPRCIDGGGAVAGPAPSFTFDQKAKRPVP